MSCVLSHESNGSLALAFVSTIRHDGTGAVADDFDDDDKVRAWVSARWPVEPISAAGCGNVRTLRRAARAAFAATVAPAPPSRADAPRLMDTGEAGRTLEAAIRALKVEQRVRVSREAVTVSRVTLATGMPLVEGALALAVVDFLTGPESGKLRACQAPRCVRYFLQGHGRQQWCKESCGNRARAARFAAARGLDQAKQTGPA